MSAPDPWYPEPGSPQAAGSTDSAAPRHSPRGGPCWIGSGSPVDPRTQWPQGLDRLWAFTRIGRARAGTFPPAVRLRKAGPSPASRTSAGRGCRARYCSRSTSRVGAWIRGPTPGRRIVEVLTAWDWQQRPDAVSPSLHDRGRSWWRPRRRDRSVGTSTDLGQLGLCPAGATPLRGAATARSGSPTLWDRFMSLRSSPSSRRTARRRPDPARRRRHLLALDDDHRGARCCAGSGSGPVLPLALALVSLSG